MGCIFEIFKSVLTLILGVAVFFGFLLLLLLNSFSDKLLSTEFYTDTINGQDTYNRIYSDVLLDDELERTTRDLLGNIDVSQEDIAQVLREILPPDYLQSQVEGSIQRTVGYFNGDRDTLDLYVELGPPMDNVKPVLLRYIDQRIDELSEEDMGSAECTPQGVEEVAVLYQNRWDTLSGGEIPSAVPSLQSFDPACRLIIFNLAFNLTVEQSGLDERSKRGLRDSRSDLEREFVEGNTRGVLKLAAQPMATHLIDDAILEITKGLDGQDRVDLIHRIAVWNDEITEPQLRDDIDTTRDWLNAGRKFGKAAALAMLIAGSVLIGLIHWPSLKNGLRWPGVTLFLTGLVFFIGGKVLESWLPDQMQDLMERGVTQMSGVPPSVTDLGGDLLLSFGDQLTDGFAGPSVVLLVVGAVMVGASILVSFLGPPLSLMRISRQLLWPLGLMLRLLISALRRPEREPDSTDETPATETPETNTPPTKEAQEKNRTEASGGGV